MATNTKKKRRSSNGRGRAGKPFDAEGLERALLAALECIYERAPHLTLTQFIVAFEVAIADRDGNPHTMKSLVDKLDIPFSTASRVVWSLTDEGGDLGVVKYTRHPSDRRKKLLVIDSRGFGEAVPRAMQRAMVEYYGDSVRRLRRSSAGRV